MDEESVYIYKEKLFHLKKSGHLENIILAGISQSEKRQRLPDLTRVESKWNVPEAGVGEGEWRMFAWDTTS